jgi:hypothetical protein
MSKITLAVFCIAALMLTFPKMGMAQTAAAAEEEALRQDVRMTYPSLQQELGLNDADFAIISLKIGKMFRASETLGPVGIVHQPLTGGSPATYGGFYGPSRVLPWRKDPRVIANPVNFARHDLLETLDDHNAPASAIKDKLETFRAAKAKAMADIVAARVEIRALVNIRQEAILVMHNILD